MNKQPTNKCSVCGKEYNYILSDGFCDGCRDCIKAQGLKLCDTIEQPMQNTPTPMQNNTMEKITEEQWKLHVAQNCSESYSLAIELAIMDLWESGVKTEEEAKKRLHQDRFELSGSQAVFAINFALTHDASDWLDRDVVNNSI